MNECGEQEMRLQPWVVVRSSDAEAESDEVSRTEDEARDRGRGAESFGAHAGVAMRETRASGEERAIERRAVERAVSWTVVDSPLSSSNLVRSLSLPSLCPHFVKISYNEISVSAVRARVARREVARTKVEKAEPRTDLLHPQRALHSSSVVSISPPLLVLLDAS